MQDAMIGSKCLTRGHTNCLQTNIHLIKSESRTADLKNEEKLIQHYSLWSTTRSELKTGCTHWVVRSGPKVRTDEHQFYTTETTGRPVARLTNQILCDSSN